MMDAGVGRYGTGESREDLERLAAGVLMVGFPGQTVPAGTVDLIARGVRCFVLFARNIGDSHQLRTLNARLRTLAGDDALIAIDHEGGRVNRLESLATPWPNPMAWSATGDLDLTRRASETAAGELAALGINLNFAPVADLVGNFHNPVLGARCFSDDPATAAAYISAFVEGHRQACVATTAKHFPGHGGTSVDSHVEISEDAQTLEQLRRTDLVPFEAAIKAGVDCLMMSHIWYSQLDECSTPAGLSENVIDLARNGLGYDGVITTDCMEMGAIQNHMPTPDAVVHAIRAGADIALVSHQLHLQQQALAALTQAIIHGTLPIKRLREAHRRIDALRMRVRAGGTAHPEGGPELARTIARQSITLVRDRDGVIPLRLSEKETLGVVTFVPKQQTGVENTKVAPPSRLIEAASTYHPHVVSIRMAGGSEPESVLEILHDADVIIVGTSFATGQPLQGAVVEALLRTGKRIIVLALRDPFDLLSFPDAPCYVAVYGETRFQIEAALAVLFGEAKPHGRLPVALPGLYPRHHGMTRE